MTTQYTLLRTLAASVLSVLCVATSIAGPGGVLQKYEDPSNTGSAFFGQAVAAVGDQPLVGAPLSPGGGAVYLYDAGQTAGPLKQLLPPAGTTPSSFGIAIATTGSEVLIGSTAMTPNPMPPSGENFYRGAVGYYADVNAAPVLYENPEKTSSLAASYGFGYALAFNAGNKFAVGDPFVTVSGLSQSGRAYIYQKGNTSPALTIENPAPASQARFGGALAFFSDAEVVPPPTETSYAGSVAVGAEGLGSVFLYSPTSGNLLTVFESPVGGASKGQFGRALATAGNHLIVGAPLASAAGKSAAGQVFIYDRDSGSLVRSLTDETPYVNGYFGSSLAVMNNRYLVVGSYSPSNAHGEVKVFDLTTYEVVLRLRSPDNDRKMFGRSVAVAGENFLVGDPQATNTTSPSGYPGQALLYGGLNAEVLPPAAPSDVVATALSASQIQVNFNDNSNNEKNFTLERQNAGAGSFTVIATLGANVTQYVDASNLQPETQYCYRVRASNDDGVSDYSAPGCVTTPVAGNPDLTGQIPNPGGAGDLFGFSISRLGKYRVVVGAPGAAKDGQTSSGKIYVFTPPSLSPNLVVENPQPAAGDRFGYSVGFLGENIVVGAPGSETNVGPSGAAYLLNGLTGGVIKRYDPPTSDTVAFGTSVFGAGKSQVVVGAPGYSTSDAGAAFLFDAGKTFNLLSTFTSATSETRSGYGSNVVLAKNRLAVTTRDQRQACTYGNLEVRDAKKGLLQLQLDNYEVLADSGGRFLAGAPQLSACNTSNAGYVALLNGTKLQLLVNSPNAGQADGFGAGLAGGKKFFAVGAPKFTTSGNDTVGRAYLYSVKSSQPARVYPNPSPDAGDNFGAAMAQAGKDQLLIGAPNDDAQGQDSGAVYLYTVPKK